MKPGGIIPKAVPLKIKTNVPTVKAVPKALKLSIAKLRRLIALVIRAPSHKGALLRKRVYPQGVSGVTYKIKILLSKLPKDLRAAFKKLLGKNCGNKVELATNIKTVEGQKIFRFASTPEQLAGRGFKAMAGVPKRGVLQAADGKSFGKVLADVYVISKRIITHSTIRKKIKDPKKRAVFVKRLIASGWKYMPKAALDKEAIEAQLLSSSALRALDAKLSKHLGNDGIWMPPK